ncbi:hypothetical protein B0J13DRAFT_172104 [Dactylonectria estremocensis]|uniref:Uncharacterized protein n=1 Tax=Dactylonectria estremocensis TaxID=1079267 RepID=A0A9P9FB88_9HYPO|nr:hypothetical protein B0J13DRAFT_172104 [Dactylonectria estremocensis]
MPFFRVLLRVTNACSGTSNTQVEIFPEPAWGREGKQSSSRDTLNQSHSYIATPNPFSLQVALIRWSDHHCLEAHPFFSGGHHPTSPRLGLPLTRYSMWRSAFLEQFLEQGRVLNGTAAHSFLDIKQDCRIQHSVPQAPQERPGITQTSSPVSAHLGHRVPGTIWTIPGGGNVACDASKRLLVAAQRQVTPLGPGRMVVTGELSPVWSSQAFAWIEGARS